MQTLAQLFDQFLQEKQYIQNCAPKTIHYFRQCFAAFRRFVTGEEISTHALTQFVILARQRGMSAGCVNAYSRGINLFLDWLHVNELIAERLRIKPLKQEKKVLRSLTEEELRKLVNFKPTWASERRTHALILTLVDTGGRIDEFLSLRRPQIDFDNLLIKVRGKGSKERLIPMSPELRKILFRYLRTHAYDLVFPTRDGDKMRYQNALRDFVKLQKRLSIPPTGFHALRRTFAKNYLRRGGNLLYLKNVLGHARLETTQVYVEVESDALQETHMRTSPLAHLPPRQHR